MKKYYFLALFSLPFLLNAQKISLENLWVKGEFFGKSVQSFSWLKNNEYYSALKDQQSIVRFAVKNNSIVDTMFFGKDMKIQDYQLSSDEKKILLMTEKEEIYRHSFKAIYYCYDISTKKMSKIAEEKICNATFSENAQQIIYTKQNNLYVYEIASQKNSAITQNGKWNEVLNGQADWVTEEEFSFTKAFWQNSTSDFLAFLVFDEKEVPVYDMQEWKNDLYPTNYSFKYPKAGEKNASLNLLVYNFQTQQIDTLLNEQKTANYLINLQWLSSTELVVQRLNRLQNQLELLKINVLTKKVSTIYQEKSAQYVEIIEHPFFADQQFLISSEKSGFRHLYWYNYEGKELVQITEGDWEVSEVLHVNLLGQKIYYTSTELGFSEKHLYVIDFDGKNKKQLTQEKGTHHIQMSSNGLYYLDYYSNFQKPLQVVLQKIGEEKGLVLENNEVLQAKLSNQSIVYPELFSFTNEKGVVLNGWIMKPEKISKKQKCPVLLYVYGGPGHQTVLNQWGGINFLWYQLLVEQGYVVISVDGQGTGGRGADFKKKTYGDLGNLEYQDQVSTANYLKTLPFIDKNRIGIWGWSFGGYVTSLCMTKGNGLFKMGIAVAPVTNWRFYDSMYSERYLKTPQENAKGYDENSPVHFANQLQGSYLLIHGTGDDNVHYQHAIAMQNALIKANKSFDMFHFPDRNHGIYGGNTRFYLYQLMTNYILKNL